MQFSKASLPLFGLILGTICLHGCGPDPRSRFISQVEAMVQKANDGKHGELELSMSKHLVERIRAEGWDPKAALVVVARRDREQKAFYRLSDVPRFDSKEYAEVEVIRISGGAEKRFAVPFFWEEGKWRVGAAHRDGRAWEAEDF